MLDIFDEYYDEEFRILIRELQLRWWFGDKRYCNLMQDWF